MLLEHKNQVPYSGIKALPDNREQYKSFIIDEILSIFISSYLYSTKNLIYLYNMSLTEKIAGDLIAAMKGKDKLALEALRAAKTAFLLAKSEKGSDSTLTSEEELKVIQRLVKQRRESAAIYKENNRQDLSEKEIAEAETLEKYLPAKVSDAELTGIIKGIIERVGAKSPADMGKVMGAAMKELAGKADGKEISEKVRQLLSV